jgi:hypothetical protein
MAYSETDEPDATHHSCIQYMLISPVVSTVACDSCLWSVNHSNAPGACLSVRDGGFSLASVLWATSVHTHTHSR